jgi:Protein of unknown function (DUF3574)
MSLRALWPVAALLVAANLAACAQHLPCDSAQAKYSAQLLFGRAIGTQGEVSETEWQDFLATSVTPAFPEGLTVTDTQGQWRDATTGALVRERSKVVTLLIDDPAAARPRIEAIADAYKQRFKQDAVGIVVTPACVAFR